MKYLLMTLIAMLVGCVSATANDSMGTVQSLKFDAPVPLGTLSTFTCSGANSVVLTTQQDTSLDFSDVLKELSKQGDLTVEVKDSYLAPSASSMADFQSLKHAKITLGGQLLAETDFTLVNGKVELPIVMPPATLVQLLTQGKQDLHLMLSTCIPGVPGNISAQYFFKLNVSFSFHKGV